MLASPPGSEPRRFFAHLADAGRDLFDVFDVHLYGDPAAIPSYVDDVRKMMRDNGYAKPVVAGEYAGPVLFEFPELEPILQQTMMSAFAEPAPGGQSVDELRERLGRDNPERRAMISLYERAGELPDRLRMFLEGCPPELEAKRHRIARRQLVMRLMLAFSSGVELASYWNLAPEVPAELEPYQMMHLLFGKLVLLGYDGTALTRRYPAADTFELVARELAGRDGGDPPRRGVRVHRRAGRPPAAARAVGRPRHLRRGGPAAGPGPPPVAGAARGRRRRVRRAAPGRRA